MKLFLIFSLFFSAVFSTAVSYAATRQGTPEEARAVRSEVESIAAEVTEILNSEDLSYEEKEDRLESALDAHFHFALMAQFVLQKIWKQMTDAQKELYTSLFRDRIIRQYMKTLVDLKITDWRINQITVSKRSERYHVTADTVISTENNSDISVSWTLTGTDTAGLKVFDVSIDGISVLVNLQQELRSQFRKQGRKIELFLNFLQEQQSQ